MDLLFLKRARLWSRVGLCRDDGFSLIEAVIALTVIFTSLTAMVYTSTIGFKYAAFARERQAATAIADQVMEGMRGIAWMRFVQGVKTSDLQAESTALGSASNVISCPGGWYFRSSLSMTCSNVGGPAPAPEKVVNTPNLPNQCTGTPAVPCPMVPNTGTVGSSATVKYPTTFTWRVYPTVSNNSGTYKLYVKVGWTGAQFGTGVVRSITVQSTFYNPAGCASSDVHVFSGPCTAQYGGSTALSASGVVITPFSAVSGVGWSTGLQVPSASTSSTMEQVAKLYGAATYGGIQVITTAGGAAAVTGGSSVSTSADGNPTTSGVIEYQTAGPTSSPPTSPPSRDAGSGAVLALGFGAASGATTVASTSAVAPTTTRPCGPSSPFVAQTDGNPCVQSWARVSQPMSATIDVGPAAGIKAGTSGYLSTLASIGATSLQYSAFGSADRLTTLVDGFDAIRHTSHRSLGTVTLFTFPSICTTFPVGWDNTKGLIQITNYSDSAIATVGPTTVTATAAVTTANQNDPVISYYDGNNSDRSYYTTILARDLKKAVAGVTNLAIPTTPIECSAKVGGKTLLVSLTAPPTAGIPFVSSGKNEQVTTSATGIKTAQASFGSPVFGQFRYTVRYDGVDKSDLIVAVDLGTVVAKAAYTPPPTGG